MSKKRLLPIIGLIVALIAAGETKVHAAPSPSKSAPIADKNALAVTPPQRWVSPSPAYDRSRFPQPIFDQEPGYIDLYWKACDLAFAHVLAQPGLPQSPYMDEAFSDSTIWIWDACFMSLFCRYAPETLPGIASLSNFYESIYEDAPMKAVFKGNPNFMVGIHHPDNPPLFAWAEWQYFLMTGDKARVKWLLNDKQYLQKHYQWFNKIKRGEHFKWAHVSAGLNAEPLGFHWTGVASGMDNSPRFGKDVFAIDALAQQGLAAKYISQLADAIGDKPLATQYQGEYKHIRDLVNEHYWDEADGFYYDLMPDGKTFSKVSTPASFWPVLAGMASPVQVARMAEHVRDPNDLGGSVPWVTVSRSDKAFDAKTGNYWHGAVWLPTAYMGIRALTENGKGDLADKTAEAVLHHMYVTYRDYDPHTIWECYNPIQPIPACHGSKLVRPDFCGWSALGPISLFIENVIGLHSVNALDRVIEWRLHQTGRHGIRNLRFSDITTDLIADGSGNVEVLSNAPYTLIINGKSLKVVPGKHHFSVSSVLSAESDHPVKPAAIFTDHMVLQRQLPVPIWGTADPGETVRVSFRGQTKEVRVGMDGKWQVKLDPIPASTEPQVLTISGKSSTVTLRDVLVGEVWLASGQSNMEFTVQNCANAEQEIAAANYPNIRELHVPHAEAFAPQEGFKGSWTVCSPATVSSFSAVAYFYSRELYTALKVPIGIIHSSYGGTPAEAWTSRTVLDRLPDLKARLAKEIPEMQAAPDRRAQFPAALEAWEKSNGVKDPGNEGFAKGWAAPDADSSDWKKVSTGFTWATALGAKSGGAYWLRKEVDLPAEAAGRSFQMSLQYLAETYDSIYFNGELVASTGTSAPAFYSHPRAYNIPGKLVKAGRNVIAVRLVTHTEKGGLFVQGPKMQLPVKDANSVNNDWLLKVENVYPPISAEALAQRPKVPPPRTCECPTVLFNAMISPLIPYAIRGAIWYQGENNTYPADRQLYYRELLPAMISDWRADWAEGDFPFYFVQLANNDSVVRTHQENDWSVLRESQTITLQNTPATGMAVAIDLGSPITIHPKNKQDVGKRLAYWALGQTYGLKEIAYRSPVYRSHQIEGNKIRVSFDTCGSPLMVGVKEGLAPTRPLPEGKLTWFEIAGEDGKYEWADAVIEKETVVVSSPAVPKPMRARYAWAKNPEGCNLYNQAGLPAIPFRSDNPGLVVGDKTH